MNNIKSVCQLLFYIYNHEKYCFAILTVPLKGTEHQWKTFLHPKLVISGFVFASKTQGFSENHVFLL
jgi:hypothetical protein